MGEQRKREPTWSPTEPRCFVCEKRPEEIEEYVDGAEECAMEPDDFMREEEGTYNPKSGAFCCTPCYIAIGMPSEDHPNQWKAP